MHLQKVRLPNGAVCYLTPDARPMRMLVLFLRWEIFQRERYRHPGFELRPSDNVLDIGGNVGMFVLWAARQVPQGRIVTVEPNPTALECLALNVEKNGLSNVEIVRAAAGGSAGTMELTYHPGYEGFTYNSAASLPWFYTGSVTARIFRGITTRFTRQPALASPRRITAPQLPLGQIMDENGMGVVDYLKLDCEGSEFEILRNLAPEHWSRIERVAMEYHLGPGRELGDLVAILERNGFEVTVENSLFDRFCRRVGKFGALWARRRNRQAA